MQIPCYELYEKEKKQNEGKSIGELYSKYKLGQDRHVSDLEWLCTNFLFNGTSENVLFYFHYYTAYRKFAYDFYIIENNGDYYIRYITVFNLGRDMGYISKKALECGEKAISNLWGGEGFTVGVRTKEYQEFIRNERMSEKIPIDKSELNRKLDEIANIDFDRSFDCLSYMYGRVKLVILDFRNKKLFYTDEYILEKFIGYVEFVEYIFSKCKISYVDIHGEEAILSECYDLFFTDSIAKAKEVIIDRHIKGKYFIRTSLEDIKICPRPKKRKTTSK